MTNDPLAGASWEEVGWIGIDAAACGFGDAVVLGPDFQLDGVEAPPSPPDVQDFTSVGLPLIVYLIREDTEVPVEVVRDESGATVAARMCATNDVDEIEGTWRPVGGLEIRSGRAMAGDPYCSPVDYYRLEFDISPGPYLAEVFDHVHQDGHPDCLALRIRRV